MDQAAHGCFQFQPLQGLFRVIVANPPYVATGDPHLAEGDCRFEPGLALSPGPDGLEATRRIARDALPCLEPGGLLAFEHGYDQGESARQLQAQGRFRCLHITGTSKRGRTSKAGIG